ncbi:hypothetical protein ACFV1N_13470 [Streptosporangium canum]|uniref:hypothetical protein n=1 Tax=Streptosporangium canum TaxID=324952 RepID=UPI0036B4D220
MSVEEIINHYRRFLESSQWISLEQLCWTIVKASCGKLDIAEIGTMMSIGGDFEIKEIEVEEGALEFSGIAAVVFVEIFDGGYFLIQTNDDYVNTNEILGILSNEARVWSIAWTGPQHRFAYAIGGEVLVDWPEFRSRDNIRGSMPDALGEEFAVIRETCQRENWPFDEAAMMAVIEMISGMRLNGDWFEGSRTAIIVRDPL